MLLIRAWGSPRPPARCLISSGNRLHSFSARLAAPDAASATHNAVVPTASGQRSHHDRQSFLEYASRVSLLPSSTLYVGTLYEYTVLEALRRLGFSLRRTGARSDLGIDLLGDWSLPSTERPLKVLVQCKALRRPVGPNHVRELTGAFAGAPSGWRGRDVVGILTAPKEATKGVREAMGASSFPLAFLKIGLDDGTIEQCLWNRAASEAGLEGLGVTIRYITGKQQAESNDRGQSDRPSREIVLTWKGNIVSPAKQDGT